MEFEERIRNLLGIKETEKISSLTAYEKRNRKYYKIITYDSLTKRAKRYHVPRNLENEILKLWKLYQDEKRSEEKLRKELKRMIEGYKDVGKVKEILEKILHEDIERTSVSFAVKTYTQKAKELLKEFKRVLLKLYEEGIFKKLSVLQVLYLLSNLRELSKSYENPDYFFNRGINTIIKVCKNERIENPFGTLKNDFFLSGRKTPYDFLLSNFLEELIGDTLLELLKTEYEKQKAIEEAREYKRKMEKLKEIARWFEEQSPEVKNLAKEIISKNVLDVAEKILKEMQITKISLKDVETFLKSSPSNRISQYFEYLRSL